MLRNLLLYRFTLFNVMGVMGVILAWQAGLVEYVYFNDTTYITSAITLLFTTVWLGTFRRVRLISHALNRQKKHGERVGQHNADKMRAKMQWLLDAGDWMVGLGLLGTVVGFSVALSGVNEGSLANAGGVSAALGPLMVGMKIALNTTIVGTIAGHWNAVNQRILRTATACYIADGTLVAPKDRAYTGKPK